MLKNNDFAKCYVYNIDNTHVSSNFNGTMKYIIFASLSLILTTLTAHSQFWSHQNYKYYKEIKDSFPNHIIQSDTVSVVFADSIRNRLLKYSQYKHRVRDNLIFYEDYYGDWWTIYTLNGATWIRIPLPFNLVDTAALINIDKRSVPELVIKGEYGDYGNGGGDVQGSLLIFNLDNSPTLIFNMLNICIEESFGERHDEDHLGEGAYSNYYERKVKIENDGITIYPNTKNSFPELCYITRIPSGHYKLNNGQFIKEK